MLYRTIAFSDHWFFRLIRTVRRSILNFSLPAPAVIFVPLLQLFLLCREAYYFVARVFVCEPLFKAYCTTYGSNLHTGVFLHWVQGRGALVIGNNVTIDGKCNFTFASRYSEKPTLTIGNNVIIGHNTSISVGDSVSIGNHCQISTNVVIFDSPGHPLDPETRRQGKPALREDVRPVVIEDDAWIGQRVVILPGVTVGRGSVVSAGSVVMTSVPPNVVVAGNPARQLRTIVQPPASTNA